MIRQIEHIGIAVSDLDEANHTYAQLLGINPYKIEHLESQNVRTSFFMHGKSKLELLEATSEHSPIYEFIQKRGEGMHHLAFLVDDIREEMKRLQNLDFTLIQEEPIKGADNKWVCFVHPKDNHGVLIELCEEIKDSESS